MSEAGSGEPHRKERPPLTIRMGHAEVQIRQRYALASIANDILVAVWFLVGSVLFFYPGTQQAGTWCFVFGSVELLVRPLIRLSRQFHLLRLHGGDYAAQETPQDF